MIPDPVAQIHTQVGVFCRVRRVGEPQQSLAIGDNRAAVQHRILFVRRDQVREGGVVSWRGRIQRTPHFTIQRSEREIVGNVTGELRGVQVATGLAGGVVTVEGTFGVRGVVVLVQDALVGRFVGCTSHLKDVAVGDIPIQLAVPLWIVVAVMRRKRRRHRIRALAHLPLGFRGRKQVQLVLNQRPANVGVHRRRPRFVVFPILPDLALRAIRIHIVEVAWITLEIIRCPEYLAAKVRLVRAAFTDLADDAAVGAAVRGAVATAENFLLVDGAIGKRQAAKAVERIGRVEAVDIISVFGDRRTTKRHQIAGPQQGTARYHTGCQQRDCLGATRNGKARQLLGGDDGT